MNEFAGYSSTRLSEDSFSKMPLHISFSSVTPFTFRTKNLKKKKKRQTQVVGGICALSAQCFSIQLQNALIHLVFKANRSK